MWLDSRAGGGVCGEEEGGSRAGDLIRAWESKGGSAAKARKCGDACGAQANATRKANVLVTSVNRTYACQVLGRIICEPRALCDKAVFARATESITRQKQQSAIARILE